LRQVCEQKDEPVKKVSCGKEECCDKSKIEKEAVQVVNVRLKAVNEIGE